MMQEFSWQVRERMREREVGDGRWREKGRERGPEKEREAQRKFFFNPITTLEAMRVLGGKATPLFYRKTQFEINIHGFKIIH